MDISRGGGEMSIFRARDFRKKSEIKMLRAPARRAARRLFQSIELKGAMRYQPFNGR
jgi:hypothetical protein